MSIISELNKTKDYLRSSRDAVLARGGEISATAGLKDLPNAIYNIPADSSLAFPSDDSVSYRKIVPVGAEQMARVTELGGMTYKCNNLLDLANAEFSFGGGSSNTSYNIIDGEKLKITIAPTATTDMWRNVYTILNVDLSQTSKLYASAIANPYNFTTSIIIFQMFEKATNTRVLNKSVEGSGKQLISVSIDIPSEYRNDNYEMRLLFYGVAGEDATNGGYIEYSDIMVSTEELPYEPYFEGLRSAKATSLKSEGANLIPNRYIQSSITQMGLTATVNSDGSIYLSGTATEVGTFGAFFLGINALANFSLPPSTYSTPVFGSYGRYRITITFANQDGVSTGRVYSTSGANTATITEKTKHLYLKIEYWITSVGEEVDITFYPMLNYGSTPAPFTPYRAEPIDTLAIPEAVQSLDGYGLGKSETEYNYIDFERKVFKQDYGKVRLLSTMGSYNANSNWYYISYITLGISPITRPVLCNLLPSVNIEGNSLYGIYTNFSQTHIVMRIDGFTTESEYKQWLADNEVYIVERLAEPIETDISAYLTSFGFLKVQGGGSIVPVEANDYEYAVPSKINYVQKVGA